MANEQLVVLPCIDDTGQHYTNGSSGQTKAARQNDTGNQGKDDIDKSDSKDGPIGTDRPQAVSQYRIEWIQQQTEGNNLQDKRSIAKFFIAVGEGEKIACQTEHHQTGGKRETHDQPE